MTNKKKTDYDVGYGKPPKQHRFKKGQSGNGKGRPKGATNRIDEDSVLTLLAREAFREVTVNDGRQTLTLPMVIIALRSLTQKAAKGDLRATTILVEQLKIVEERGASDKAKKAREASHSLDEYLNSLSMEQLEEFIQSLDEAQKANQPSPSPTQKGRRGVPAKLAGPDQSE